MTRLLIYRAIIVVVFGSFLFSFLKNWHLISHQAYPVTSGRVQSILDSSKCSQRTGIVLANCSNSQAPVGVESLSLADDRGHNLLANIVSFFKSEPLTPTTITLNSLFINAIGLLALTFCFFIARMPIAGLLCLFFGAYHGIPGPFVGPESPASYFGVYCLAAAPTVLLIGRMNSRSSLGSDLLISSFVIVSLSWAILLRQSMGIVGIASSLISIFFMILQSKNFGARLRLALLTVCLISLTGLPDGILKFRSWVYSVPRGTMVSSHGFAHTLYAGLGSEPNPWGIKWDDSLVWKQIEAYNPKAEYGTESHFSTAREMYLNIIRDNPKAVAKIYWEKLKTITTGYRLQTGTLAFWLVLTALVLSVAAVFSLGDKNILIMTFGLYVGALLIIVQGVLATYDDHYIYPARFAVLLLPLCVLEWARRLDLGFNRLVIWRPTT